MATKRTTDCFIEIISAKVKRINTTIFIKGNTFLFEFSEYFIDRSKTNIHSEIATSKTGNGSQWIS